MSLNANSVPSTKLGSYEPMEAGTSPARLVHVIDLGLQSQPDFKGEKKDPARMIALTYEFLDEFMKDEDGQPDPLRPRHITEMLPFYPLSSEKAKCTKRYLALDPNQTHGGDWVALLGTPLLATVVLNPSTKNGTTRIYENIASIAAMRSKDIAGQPELKNPTISFDLDQPDVEAFKRIPKFLQDKIRSNLEYAGSPLEKLLGGITNTPPKTEAKGKPALKVVADNTTDEEEPPY